MAIKMTQPAYQNAEKHRNYGFDPIEFICRGRIREEKDMNLEALGQRTELTRNLLKKTIQEFFQEHFTETANQESQERPQSTSFVARFTKWLWRESGEDRIKRLRKIEGNALKLKSEARWMDANVAAIVQMHNEYKNNAAMFLMTARDAVDHERLSRCGWTSWR